MKALDVFPWPAGHEVLRLLSEGEGGRVALARRSSGELVVLKLLRLVEDVRPEDALARHQRLCSLTTEPGLLRIFACGLSADQAWLWEELEPADDLKGGPATARLDYEPATLRRELIERGPFSTTAVLDLGVRVCAGLAALHAHGLVHRDVKPDNLFRVGGRVVLGDYGLTAPPAGPFDFRGTEGFVPGDGARNAAADLFALGKTLYELWTGCDRLEFPTLPRRVLDSPDWSGPGAALNELLLRVCSPRLRERYTSASQLAVDLRAIAEGRTRRITRRQWLATAGVAGLLTGGVALGIWKVHRPPVARWRLRKSWGYIPVEWGDQMPMLDARRHCLFHLQISKDHSVLGRLDLDSYQYTKLEVDRVTLGYWPILHPLERTIWLAETGLGPVWRLDPDTGRFTRLPGGQVPAEVEQRSHQNRTYWNPVTRRLGIFGGYGWFAVRNWRWEFNAEDGQWLCVEPNRPGQEPRCRQRGWLLPRGDGTRLLLFGGYGNLSGKQDAQDPGMPGFDGIFHNLGDLWELDLATNRWTCLIPAPGLAVIENLVSACWLEQLETLVVMRSRDPQAPFGTPGDLFIFRPGRDRDYVAVPSRGDVPDGARHGYITALPSGRSFLAFQKAGVFEVELES